MWLYSFSCIIHPSYITAVIYCIATGLHTCTNSMNWWVCIESNGCLQPNNKNGLGCVENCKQKHPSMSIWFYLRDLNMETQQRKMSLWYLHKPSWALSRRQSMMWIVICLAHFLMSENLLLFFPSGISRNSWVSVFTLPQYKLNRTQLVKQVWLKLLLL